MALSNAKAPGFPPWVIDKVVDDINVADTTNTNINVDDEYNTAPGSPERKAAVRRAMAQAMKRQDLADRLIRVPLASLLASDEQRHINTEAVDRMKQSLKEIGLIQPITVTSGIAEYGFRIVAGHHRVAAARLLGWADIAALVLTDTGDLSALLIQIDENLVRCELSAAQRASAISRRKVIWEALHPKGGRNSLTPGGVQKIGFAADTQAVSGESKRRVNEHLARAEALGDDLNAVVGTSLDKGVELDALKDLPADQRKDLVKRAVSGEKVSAKTTVKLKPAAPPPSPRASSKLVPVPRADMNHALNALNKSLTATRAFLEATRGYPMARRSEIAALTKKLNASVAALDALLKAASQEQETDR